MNREISVPGEEVLDILMTDRVNGARARAGSGSQMGPKERDPRPKYLDWSWAGTIVHGGASRAMSLGC